MIFFSKQDTRKLAKDARRRARAQAQRKRRVIIRTSLLLFAVTVLCISVWSLMNLKATRLLASSEKAIHETETVSNTTINNHEVTNSSTQASTTSQSPGDIPIQDSRMDNNTENINDLGQDSVSQINSSTSAEEYNSTTAEQVPEKSVPSNDAVPHGVLLEKIATTTGDSTTGEKGVQINAVAKVAPESTQVERASTDTDSSDNSILPARGSAQSGTTAADSSRNAMQSADTNMALNTGVMPNVLAPETAINPVLQQGALSDATQNVMQNMAMAAAAGQVGKSMPEGKEGVTSSADGWDDDEEDSLGDEEGGTAPVITLQKQAVDVPAFGSLTSESGSTDPGISSQRDGSEVSGHKSETVSTSA